jgi:hypothetical protein
MWWPGTELNRRRQPFQNSDFQCFQQLQGLPWDCHTLENTGKTEGSWVIAVGDSSMGFRGDSNFRPLGLKKYRDFTRPRRRSVARRIGWYLIKM